MLLEFKTSNYKSFKEELNFSMVPAPKQKGLDDSILQKKIGKKTYKALSSSVIYGANASGKTNIIGAMETFKKIILRGNIKNSSEVDTPNNASYLLEFIPNSNIDVKEPVTFSIKFVSESMLFEYCLSLDLGEFLDEEYPRKVLVEKLMVNEEIVFDRSDGLIFGNLKVINDLLVNEFAKNEDSIKSIASSNLNPEELFLMNGFKAMFSSKLVEIITKWLNEKFVVVYRADSIELSRKINDNKKNNVYVETQLNAAASSFGINSNAIGFVVDSDSNEARLCSLLNDKVAVPAEMFESYGTIRFINIFPLIASAIVKGNVLVIDEFDASIHPMALMNIINIFHNDSINKNNAQLIFNTHNPIFLNSNLYRRDEIKFVERDDMTHNSIHYSLSDFGTFGKNGVRKDEDYIKNYFIDRYGAIKDIDFSDIFESIVNYSNKGE